MPLAPPPLKIAFVNDQKGFWLSFNQKRFNHQMVIKTFFGH
jgi:hypothetical protein